MNMNYLNFKLNIKKKYGIKNKYFIVCNQFWLHKNHKNALSNNNSSPIEMNQFYETLIELSNSFPASYGLFCIFLAVGLGILASFSRRSLGKYKKKFSPKKAAW